MEKSDCPWCGAQWQRPVFSRGKYICGRCARPLMDCCDGEQAQIEAAAESNCTGFEDSEISAKNCKGKK
tara:strand:- start:281 stop:487 length:207 start_codon:yes stop_codon:yes gene_type:complete